MLDRWPWHDEQKNEHQQGIQKWTLDAAWNKLGLTLTRMAPMMEVVVMRAWLVVRVLEWLAMTDDDEVKSQRIL